jgi:hypothetical protein
MPQYNQLIEPGVLRSPVFLTRFSTMMARDSLPALHALLGGKSKAMPMCIAAEGSEVLLKAVVSHLDL